MNTPELSPEIKQLIKEEVEKNISRINIQLLSFSQSAKLMNMRLSDFIKQYIISGKLPFIDRGRKRLVAARDLFNLQESEKVVVINPRK
jgi:hypothetical protein